MEYLRGTEYKHWYLVIVYLEGTHRSGGEGPWLPDDKEELVATEICTWQGCQDLPLRVLQAAAGNGK
jgi:hypothetical protein